MLKNEKNEIVENSNAKINLILEDDEPIQPEEPKPKQHEPEPNPNPAEPNPNTSDNNLLSQEEIQTMYDDLN